MSDIQKAAEKALSYLERRTRDDGTEYYCTNNDRPQWLEDLIFKAHFDKLPEDYTYEFIHDALNIISENEDEDGYLEGLDQSVDIYTSGLTNWLNSRNDRVYYLNEAMEEFPDNKDGFMLLAIAQYKEREEVFNSVLSSLQDFVNDDEEENE